MKNLSAVRHGKNKKLVFIFKICALLPFLFWAVFLSNRYCLADTSLKITDVQFNGEIGKTDEDFIEITNISESAINLDGYRLVKTTSSGKRYNVKSWESSIFILAGESYLWANSKNGFAENIKADTSTSETISKENEILIILGKIDDGTVVDSFIWKEIEADDIDKESEYVGKVKINEIKAETSKEEFVEIISKNDYEDLNFFEWCIKDEIKHNKTSWDCKKPSSIEKKGNFYTLSGSFSLNNDTDGDTVYFYDKDKNLVDSVSYKKAKSKYSYSFDGTAWRWTSQQTPGAVNIFDKILSGKIKKDNKIYAGAYANFEVSADKDAQKFTWDFGDGHKSYLKKTKHKYEKAGIYSASLKITGEGEDAFYVLTVKVEKYKAPKVRIVKFSPNPKGNDTKNEWIEIKNQANKKINLKGWSIAAGWDNLYNHPIRKDFRIKPGKTKKLTRKMSAFSLNNEKTRLELRDPSGKTVQKIKYDRKKNKIEEEEIYAKIEGGWEWEKNAENIEEIPPNEKDNTPQEKIETISIDSELQANIGKYSPSPDWQRKKESQIKLISLNLKIKTPEALFQNQGMVLGAQKINIKENRYLFTKPRKEERRTANFLEKNWKKINFWLNKLLLKI